MGVPPACVPRQAQHSWAVYQEPRSTGPRCQPLTGPCCGQWRSLCFRPPVQGCWSPPGPAPGGLHEGVLLKAQSLARAVGPGCRPGRGPVPLSPRWPLQTAGGLAGWLGGGSPAFCTVLGPSRRRCGGSTAPGPPSSDSTGPAGGRRRVWGEGQGCGGGLGTPEKTARSAHDRWPASALRVSAGPVALLAGSWVTKHRASSSCWALLQGPAWADPLGAQQGQQPADLQGPQVPLCGDWWCWALGPPEAERPNSLPSRGLLSSSQPWVLLGPGLSPSDEAGVWLLLGHQESLQ